jgi:arylsulfatase
MFMSNWKSRVATGCALVLLATGAWAQGSVSAKKPNVLVIMADDVGPFNISAYNHGMMGYRTPNIDRLARDGAMF